MDYGQKHEIGTCSSKIIVKCVLRPGQRNLIAENMRPWLSRKSLCKACNRATLHAQKGGFLVWQPA
jgi:hypothetical protein